MCQHGKWFTKLCEKVLFTEPHSTQFYGALIDTSIKNSKHKVVVLDAGCGENPSVRRYNNALTIGADIDWILKKSDVLDHLVICSLEALPFKSESFDIIANRWVIEHLENPKVVFQEFFRTLKKKGKLILFTVNLMNYAMLISHFTPFWFHTWCRQKLLNAPLENFPTFYRANTVTTLTRMLSDAGFRKKKLVFIGGAYGYLKFSKILYLIALLANRIANWGLLNYFKLHIIACFEKSK